MILMKWRKEREREEFFFIKHILVQKRRRSRGAE
jgi:predicted GNAT superfamily acetyltransferase